MRHGQHPWLHLHRIRQKLMPTRPVFFANHAWNSASLSSNGWSPVNLILHRKQAWAYSMVVEQRDRETRCGRDRFWKNEGWANALVIQRRGNKDSIADMLLQAVESTLFGVKDVETMMGNGDMDGTFRLDQSSTTQYVLHTYLKYDTSTHSKTGNSLKIS